jgi:hypothetical protein
MHDTQGISSLMLLYLLYKLYFCTICARVSKKMYCGLHIEI